MKLTPEQIVDLVIKLYGAELEKANSEIARLRSRRVVLPIDTTRDEFWQLYHNHVGFNRFVQELVAQAQLAWERHHKWERAL